MGLPGSEDSLTIGWGVLTQYQRVTHGQTDRQTDVQPIATRRMAIANGTCVSFCNQPKAHYLAISRESRRYVVAGVSIWLRQESLSHILASTGYARGTIAINFTWMEREVSFCQMHRSIYPSIFNRFPVIEPEKSNVRHFSTFLYILASPGYASGTIAVIVTWIEREFNACQTPRSMYPSIFNRFPVTQAVSLTVRHFSTFLHILASPGCSPGTIAVNVTRL